MAHPTTEAPKTQIYFITHRSGAFLVLRLRTVARGERASQSIVNRTTALWSIWVVASLILAGADYLPFSHKRGGAKSPFRAALTGHLIVFAVILVDMMDSTTNKRKETNINSGVVL